LHPGAAEDLHFQVLALATGPQDGIDQLFHGVVAVACAAAHRRRPAIARARGLGQHEMVHAADPAALVAHAGGDTRTEHGGHHLLLGADIELAGQDLHRHAVLRRVPEPPHVLEAGQYPLRVETDERARRRKGH